MSVDEIAKEALSLPNEARAFLADRLAERVSILLKDHFGKFGRQRRCAGAMRCAAAR